MWMHCEDQLARGVI
jgi:hypothetical protein